MEVIRFVLNGEEVEIGVDKRETLLQTLRERLNIKSVKEGCSIGECGACTVLIDDKPFYSCLTLSAKIKDRHVKTVEYLNRDGLHPLQASFIEKGAVQCGYCTPGMILSAYSLLLNKKNPTPYEVKKAISGNLCRCTGYIQIVEAIIDASKKPIDRVKEEKTSYKKQKKTKNEILETLSRLEDPVVFAGGTDVLVKYRSGEIQGEFIDITECGELNGIKKNDGKILIGATTTHTEINENDILIHGARALSMASGVVGSPQIRNMGTIGGNVINASPAADTIPALMIHNALCKLESKDEKRIIPLDGLIIAPYKTSIRKGEILTEIEIEELKDYKEGYIKVGRREALAISRISIAYAVKERNGVYEDVRVAVGSVTPRPFRAKVFEERLKGKEKDKAVVMETCEILFKEIRDLSEERPSYRYKFPVLRDLILKILTE